MQVMRKDVQPLGIVTVLLPLVVYSFCVGVNPPLLVHDKVPDPLVVSTSPSLPAVAGSVSVTLLVTVAGALIATLWLPSASSMKNCAAVHTDATVKSHVVVMTELASSTFRTEPLLFPSTSPI